MIIYTQRIKPIKYLHLPEILNVNLNETLVFREVKFTWEWELKICTYANSLRWRAVSLGKNLAYILAINWFNANNYMRGKNNFVVYKKHLFKNFENTACILFCIYLEYNANFFVSAFDLCNGFFPEILVESIIIQVDWHLQMRLKNTWIHL